MKYPLFAITLYALFSLFALNRYCASQTGPKLEHPGLVSLRDPVGGIVVSAETTFKQYPVVDLYVSLDSPFPPTKLGSVGTLFINPGALVYWLSGLHLSFSPQQPWVTFTIFYYPPIPFELLGTKFRVQVVAYDATVPNRVVLSANYVTVTIVN
jgi:hypothetical protein